MKILTAVVATAVMMILLGSAVLVYRETLCRQKSWAKAFELKTRTLLSESADNDLAVLPHCRTLIKRKQEKVTWQKVPGFKSHAFTLPLKGKL